MGESRDRTVYCRILHLGRLDYGSTYTLQRELCRQRFEGAIPDTLLLVEHPPTITVGKSGKLSNILAEREVLRERGVSLFLTDRGGDVTYHGPGQLVAYPIMDLRQRGRDIHGYVRGLEETAIRTLALFSIAGTRNEHPGVWVRGKQIAAIGIAVKRWVTMHGLSLNVNPDMGHFSLINPCGQAGVGVTSISAEKGEEVPIDAVRAALVDTFLDVFGSSAEACSARLNAAIGRGGVWEG